MIRILLIEDDTLTRITIGQFLGGEGYEVDEAEDGVKALSLLDANKYDLILSDIVMPKVNGFAIVDHASSASPSTPVILMTAYAVTQFQATTAQRAVEVILKPILLDDLLSRVRRVLEQQN
ncbi:MAG: response regulator [Candidatus Binatia bacterium]